MATENAEKDNGIKKLLQENLDLKTEQKTPVSKSRVEILVRVAKIDNKMQEILKTILIPSSDDHDDVLDEGGIVGSFQLRAKLSSRLGLIGPTTYWAIKKLAKIRNICAHRDEDIDIFKLSEVNSHIEDIWIRFNDNLKRQGTDEKPITLTVEEKFIEICEYMLLALPMEAKRFKPIKPLPNELLF